MKLTSRMLSPVLTAAMFLSCAAALALPPTTTSLSLSQTSVAQGTPIVLSATVQGSAGAITEGQVAFCDIEHVQVCTPASANLLALAQVTTTGKATAKLRLGTGTHPLIARFIGTTANAASRSSTKSLSVTARSGAIPTMSSVMAMAINPGPQQGLYSLAATVTSGRGNPAPSGNVSFEVTSPHGTTTIASPKLTASTEAVSFGLAASAPAATGNSAVADFNEDGIPDLAVAGAPGVAVSVLVGKGDGTFATASSATLVSGLCSAACIQVATADFNSDGHADLAVLAASGSGAQTNYSLQFAYGKGNGTFTVTPPTALTLAPSSTAPQLVVGDYNGDGQPDLIVNGGGLAVALQQPDHTFKLSYPQSFGGSGYTAPSFLLAADFNNDSKSDFVGVSKKANSTTSVLAVFLSNGDGTFTAQSVDTLAAGQSYDFPTVGDLNGDGFPDLAIFASNDSNEFGYPYLNNGQAGFTAQPLLVLNLRDDAEELASDAVDVNGDGLADLLLITTGQDGFGTAGQVFISGSSSTCCNSIYFTLVPVDPGSTSSVNPPFPVSPVIAVDLNGDGLPDTIYRNIGYFASDNGCCSVFLNQTGAGVSAATIDSIQMPTGGQLALTANYAAQGNFGASVSPAVPVNGTPVTTTLALTAAPQQTTSGQAVTLTATLSPYTANGYSTDGETVTFSVIGSSASYSANLHAGVASFVIANLPVGTDQIYANYNGDSVFFGSESDAIPVVVSPAVQANTHLLGTYTFHVNGSLPAANGATPGAAIVGAFSADGAGNISGEEDVNSTPQTATASNLQGTYSLNANGTGVLHMVNDKGFAEDFVIVVSSLDSTGIAHGISLLGTSSNGIVASGEATLRAYSNLAIGGFTLQLDGETACQGSACSALHHGAGSVSLLGSTLDALGSGSGTVAENVGGTVAVYPNGQLVFGPEDAYGRIPVTLTGLGSAKDQPTHFAGYVQSAGLVYLLSTDPHASFILLRGSLVQQ